MSAFEKEIPAIIARPEHFAHFVFGSKRAKQLPDEVNEIVQAARDNVTRVEIMLDEAYADLRVDMQFNESRRSMSETRTVTRLTELAFVFIQLSFYASLFSMSIREIGDGVPVWIFIITSLVMMSIAYGVRILVGSEILANSTRRSFERFWEITGFKPSNSEKAPMLTVFKFHRARDLEECQGLAICWHCWFDCSDCTASHTHCVHVDIYKYGNRLQNHHHVVLVD